MQAQKDLRRRTILTRRQDRLDKFSCQIKDGVSIQEIERS